MVPHSFRIRQAQRADIPTLHRLIEVSVRVLQAGDTTPEQMEGALGGVLGLDTQLILDGTYFLVETEARGGRITVGCGGWSYRRTLFGSDHGPRREPARLDPAIDAAKIRAIFVHPDWARRGIGSLVLKHCEEVALQAGFRSWEMGSTLTGLALYRLKGYEELERIEVPLPNGQSLPVVRMRKSINL